MFVMAGKLPPPRNRFNYLRRNDRHADRPTPEDLAHASAASASSTSRSRPASPRATSASSRPGRSRPSEQMVLHLAEQLEVPLRERNRLLLAAGYAPVFSERPLSELGPIKDALDQLLKSHEPFPAIVVDRGWNVVAANAAIPMLTAGAAPHLLEPPINALRLTLHPEGMAPRITNLGQWRAHLLRDLAAAGRGRPATTTLRALLEELRGYPGPEGEPGAHEVFVPLEIDGLELPQHPHELLHRARRDRLRAGDRVLLPRRRDTPRRRFTTRRGDARAGRADRPSSAGTAPASGRPRPAARDRARTSAAARRPARAPAPPRAARAGAWRRPAGSARGRSTSSPTRCSRSRSRSRMRRRDGIGQDVEDLHDRSSITAKAYSARR